MIYHRPPRHASSRVVKQLLEFLHSHCIAACQSREKLAIHPNHGLVFLRYLLGSTLHSCSMPRRQGKRYVQALPLTSVSVLL